MEIHLYNDVAFQWAFGRQENTIPIKSLLNAVVRFDGTDSEFEDIQIVNPFDIASYPNEKNGILDIRVFDKQTKHWADVEIQVRYQPIYPERSLYYLAGLYRDQLRSGEGFENLKPCFGVHIMVADLFREKEDTDWFSHFRMLNIKNHRLLSNHLELFYIELEKFFKVHKNKKEEYRNENELTQWCEFIANPVDPNSPLNPKFKNNKGIQEVYAMLTQFTEDDRIREKYRLHEEWVREQRYFDNLMKRQTVELEKQKAEAEKLKAEAEKLKAEADLAKANTELMKKQTVKLLKEIGTSDKDISEKLGISEKEVKEIVQSFI